MTVLCRFDDNYIHHIIFLQQPENAYDYSEESYKYNHDQVYILLWNVTIKFIFLFVDFRNLSIKRKFHYDPV